MLCQPYGRFRRLLPVPLCAEYPQFFRINLVQNAKKFNLTKFKSGDNKERVDILY
jgi:hypothetical protein